MEIRVNTEGAAINFAGLVEGFKAAFGAKFQGAVLDNIGNVLVVEAEDTVTGQDVLDVVSQHNPAQLTPGQLKAQKAVAALAELGASDYATWKAGVEGITTLNQAKTRLEQLGRVVWLLLQAQGIKELP